LGRGGKCLMSQEVHSCFQKDLPGPNLIKLLGAYLGA
jgi:hypothetical protein